MRVTKLGHSCVRLSAGGHDVVLDPGGWSEREAVEGVAAVLITHEHPDHWNAEHLRSTDAPIFTIAAVQAQLTAADPALGERVTVVRPGDRLDVAGLDVQVVGEKHAVIHPEWPRPDNSGYLVTAEDRSVFHPGDSFQPPGREVDVFCAPVCAPWAKMSDLLDLAREVAAPQTLGIHDKTYSDYGLALVDGQMRAFLESVGSSYFRPASGHDL